MRSSLLLVVACALLSSVFAAYSEVEFGALFKNFTVGFEKKYATEAERLLRYNVFKKNMMYIEEHNSNPKNTYQVGVNEFADLTNEEFKKIYLSAYKPKVNRSLAPVLALDAPPASFDWREKGIVTKVKNQGQCGSCWAFSAVGSIEGQQAKASGKLVSLSEQNLVDCDKTSDGCKGGLMDLAFQYVIKNGGIDTEECYPYHGRDGQCNYNANCKGANITSFVDIPSGSEPALLNAVYSVGPVSVAIDASGIGFQLYKVGVYHSDICGNTEDKLDHGVLVVGWGVESIWNKNYYIVKNSWGAAWGKSGYIWMSRDRNNNCGIATAASYPLI